MPTIHHLYKSHGLQLIHMEKTDISPVDIFTNTSTIDQSHNTKYTAIMDHVVEEDKKISVDLLKVFTLTDVLAEAQLYRKDVLGVSNYELSDITWEDIEASITDKHILGYFTNISDITDVKNNLISVQILHRDEFGMSYCMMQTPEDRNVHFRRWQLLDLAITKLNPDSKINLDKSLLSVNGCISRPFFYKDELIMPQGARFLHNMQGRTPSITLLDFSNFGGITTIPFSECTYSVRNARDIDSSENAITIVPGYDIEISIPEKYSLTDKTVYMVLGYSLYFNDAVLVNSDRSVIISPHMLCLGDTLIKSNYTSNIYSDYTNVVSSQITPHQLINEEVWKEDYHGAFLVVIDRKTININRTPIVRYAKDRMYIGVPGIDGLLWDDTYHSVIDHTNLQYPSVSDIYTMPQPELVSMTCHDPYDNNYAIEDVHPYYAKLMEYKERDVCVLNLTSI